MCGHVSQGPNNTRTADTADLAHHTAVAVAQQQVCALHVEVHNALRVQVLHPLLHDITALPVASHAMP